MNAYTGVLFGQKKPSFQDSEVDIEKLVAMQMSQLRETYKTECLDAKQLQTALNVGESSVYAWMKECKYVRIINRRKLVPIVWVAYYLVTGGVENE